MSLFRVALHHVARSPIGMAALVTLTLSLLILNIYLFRRLRRRQAQETIDVQWCQTTEEVEVTAPMPEGASAKDVICRVLPTRIHLAVRGFPLPLLKGELTKKATKKRSPFELPYAAPGTVLHSHLACSPNEWPLAE